MTPEWESMIRFAMAEIGRLRGELAEQRRELKATQAAWLVEVNKIARVRELCDETDGPPTVRKDVILAALEGNQP